MHIAEIGALTYFLASTPRSIDDICRYLVLHTFRSHAANAIYLGQVEKDGHLLMKSSFGFEEKYISQWERIPLALNVPIVEAVRNSSEALFLTKEEFFANYPQVNSLGIVGTDWESCVASSIQFEGAYMLVFNSVPKIDSDFKSFLQTIGHLISLHLHDSNLHFKNEALSNLPRKALTSRQELIRDLLVKGFSNPYIAQEIGYSESLVRQETIIIYSAMRVSGRKELMNLMESQGVRQE
jgi:hypothetical protein